MLKFAHYHIANFNTVVGFDVSHRFNTGESILTMGAEHWVGGQHRLDSPTSLKGRLNTLGIAYALLQHKVSKSVLTLSGEFDVRAIHNPPRLGLSWTFKP